MNAPPARESVRAVAIEAALAELERALCRDRCHVVVSASTGTAKALLLGALAERVAGSLRVIPVPAAEDGVDLCARILRELGEPAGEDSEASLVTVIRQLSSQGSALALVAGDARALPETTLRRLGRLAARTRPGLRLVLVSDGTGGSDRDAIAEFMAPLGIGAVKVVLDAPLHREPTLPGGSAAPAFGPPRLPASLAASRATPVRARRVVALSGPSLRRAMRFTLAGLAAAAFGFAAANRIERPREATAALPREEAPAPAPALPDPTQTPIPPLEPAAEPAPHAEVAAKPSPSPAAPETAPPRVAAPPPEPAPASDAAAVATALPAPTAVAAIVPVEPPIEPPIETPVPAPVEAPPVPTIAVSLNALPWAHIEIDGLDVGVTPMADVRLSEGPHRFRARFPDGRVIERTVRVDAVRDHITFP